MGLDDRLPLASRAVLEDRGEVLAEALDRSRAGRSQGDVHGSEFVAAGSELAEFGREVAYARAAGAFVECAVLECGEVPVDGGLGCGDLSSKGLAFFVVPAAALLALRVFGGDRGVDEVRLVVEVD